MLTTVDAGSNHASTGAIQYERTILLRGELIRRYRVEYLIVDPIQPADAVRREFAAWLGTEPHGGAIVVASDETLIKVHLTTARPEIALAVGRSAGALTDVIVEPRCSGASWERAA
jgi:dihydroxyacetone kinase-like predicted kinase